jgi:hypothetical protein
MNKIYGATERQDGLYLIGRNKWELIYGFGKDDDSAETGYNYRQRFTRKPTLDEIKSLIVATINADTEEKIVSGFVWDGKPVWLSSENQFNYKSAYDLAVQTGGSILPVTFKFGTDDNVQYHTFNTLDELTSFYTACFGYVSQCLANGWAEKDALDKDMTAFTREL